MSTRTRLSRARMLRAFLEKDAAYEGTFVVAVKTTGIFCRPTCRAKRPRPENVEFFASTDEAQRRGYRPCKLCRPLDASRRPALVERLMRVVDGSPQRATGPGRALREHDLRALGVAPATARRLFRQHTGMPFAAYQRSRRVGDAVRGVRNGAAVIDAQVLAGFNSGSGFRDAATRLFGVAPSDARTVNLLASRWIETPLGDMLAVANDEGLLLLDFHDRKGLPRAIERLRQRCGTRGQPAVIAPSPADHEHLAHAERELRDYFAGRLQRFTVTTAPRGSAFERRVWAILRDIPYGTTRSYAEQARLLGNPAAVRAVARANGMNYLSIVIPCHRVIGANGALTGYGGGLARKRWLLDHERATAAR